MGIAYYRLGKFDKTIKSYIKSIEINPNKSGAYTNLFELQLTQKQAFDQVLEESYKERFEGNKESFIQYEMLKLLQNIVNAKPYDIEIWKKKYAGVGLGGWSFYELNEWVKGRKSDEVKKRLLEVLKVFEGYGK